MVKLLERQAGTQRGADKENPLNLFSLGVTTTTDESGPVVFGWAFKFNTWSIG